MRHSRGAACGLDLAKCCPWPPGSARRLAGCVHDVFGAEASDGGRSQAGLWRSIAVLLAGYAALAIENFFLPGGFHLALGSACVTAMALGLLGALVFASNWWQLRRAARRT